MQSTIETVTTGTPGNDTLVGGEGPDIILGLAGNDVVFESGGSNQIFGGRGNDLISGGVNDDQIFGGPGNDFLSGGIASLDSVTTDSDDQIFGGSGNDVLTGTAGRDILWGGSGHDFFIGGADADIFSGGSGIDLLINEGLPNVDNSADSFLLAPGEGPDLILDFQDTLDQLVFTGGLTAAAVSQTDIGNTTLVRATETDELLAVLRPDFRFDTAATNEFTLFNGKKPGETVVGGPASDFGSGGPGDDVFRGKGSFDAFQGDSGNDTLFGDDGTDILGGGEGRDRLYGGDSDDVLWGDAGNDLVVGGAGLDVLTGDQGRDILDGGEGVDIVSGGQGRDTFVLSPTMGEGDLILDFEDGRDQFVLTNDLTFEQLSLTQGDGYTTLTVAASGEDLATLVGVQADQITAADFASQAIEIKGTGRSDQRLGTAAADHLRGRGGNDFLDGGAGDDQIDGNQGNDLLWGGVGNDTLAGGKGDDVVVGREGDDVVFGDAGDDVVIGTDGADQLAGGTGYDVLVGDTPFAAADGDTFRLTSGEQTDIVVDFQVGVDSLELAENVNVDDLQLRMLGNNTLVQAGETGEVLAVLRGVEATSLGELTPVTGPANAEPSEPGGLTGVEVVTGTNNADTLAGGDVMNVLDFINGGTGDDTLSDTAPGFSVINGDRGNDSLTGGPLVNILNGGQGADQLMGADNAVPGASADASRYFADYLFGGNGNDALYGFGEDDVLVGGRGRDVLDGGDGHDILVGGRGRDTFMLASEAGSDIVLDFEDRRDVLALDDTLSFGQLSISQGDGYTAIGVAGSDQTLAFLVNVQAEQITAADFA